jgi:4-alpha-glucanotransferase
MDGLEQLLYLQGVSLEYTSYQGENINFSNQARCSVLSACGYNIDDEVEVEKANFTLDVKPWLQLLPLQCFSCQDDEHFTVRIAPEFSDEWLHWNIYQDDKLIINGSAVINSLVEVGNYHHQGKRYSERRVVVSEDTRAKFKGLPIGYYQLVARIHLPTDDVLATTEITNHSAKSELIVYPKQVYQPNTQRCWGISAQLYTLVSNENFGIGDFNDLTELISHSAAAGADYILLNPLHALFEDQAERASPYSPSDRFCLNPIYIHIQDCPEYSHSHLAQQLVKQQLSADADKLTAMQSEKSTTYIDYQKVVEFKYPVFIALFDSFQQYELSQNSARYQKFLCFKTKNNDRIKRYSHWLLARNNLAAQYNHVDFICYLQWLAHEQLAQCQSHAKSSRMKIGLINDLAVGCSADGHEFSSHEHLFVNDVSIGAPPDPWAPLGQSWGLPPMNPIKLKQNGFTHFRQLLKVNMRDCGAIRLDHVMALMRLWWHFTHNKSEQNACYVYYPFEQMLSILNLESHLNQCAVIGEDLGVVPERIESALANAGVFSNSLFYFSKNQDGQFTAPEHLPEHTLMMIANHDVATFTAWWLESDLEQRQQLHLFTAREQFELAKSQRKQDKVNLLIWLSNYSLNKTSLSPESDAQLVYQALVLVLASSKVSLLTLQLDDLAEESLPVNIPGTDSEYPNWRRRLSKNSKQILTSNMFLSQLAKNRQQAK